MSRTLVVGVDAGGTSTRCVVAALDGRIVARGAAGGANQNSSGGGWAGPLEHALVTALSTVDAADVGAGVVGAAGAGRAGLAAAQAAATAAWRRAGLPGGPVTVTDLEVAYAAGTPDPDGALLLAGTGAAAVRFAGGAPVRRCDGYGWLLGDEGSAVWIGVRVLRAALAALDGRGRPTVLVTAACERLGVSPIDDREDLAQALLAAAHAAPPAALGRLAPAAGEAAAAGDAVARRLVRTAAGRLLHSLATVLPAAGPGTGVAWTEERSDRSDEGRRRLRGPRGQREWSERHQLRCVVLAGSVLLGPGPVADAVRAGVARRYGVTPVTATDGAAGAAALAIARLLGAPVPAIVHSRLTAGHEPDRG
jgi:glucosamine kinase